MKFKALNWIFVVKKVTPIGCGDLYGDYNDEDPRGLVIEDLLNKIKKLKIDYTFGKINDSTDIMIAEFNRVMGGGFVNCADMAEVKNFSFMAVESISTTIEKGWREGGAHSRIGFMPPMSAISEKSVATVKTMKVL